MIFARSSEKKDLAKGRVGYSDRTTNRILAHLKTLAMRIHELKPFPLGNPMAKTKLMLIGDGLETERAIVHTLIETGMRRAAVRNIDLSDVDFERRLINVEEKGGRTHSYKISRGGISAIEDYVTRERAADSKKWKSPALFLSTSTNTHGDGRLNPRVINTVFKEVCSLAGVEDHTPHDARHAMGRHLIEKTDKYRSGSKTARPHQRSLLDSVRQDHRPGAG